MSTVHLTFRRDIFRYALSAGKRGITTDEIAAAFKTVPNCVSGRMTEMKKLGWLIPADKFRLTRRRKPAEVWLANPEFKWLPKAWELKERHNGKITNKENAA